MPFFFRRHLSWNSVFFFICQEAEISKPSQKVLKVVIAGAPPYVVALMFGAPALPQPTAQPGEQMAQGDLTKVYKNLRWGQGKKDKARDFSVLCIDRTRGNELWNTDNSVNYHKDFLFFTVQVVKHCKMLPREAVESPLMEIFKSQLDEPWAIFSHWLGLSRGWTR